ncbi:GAF domain-containing sensor histidine kinase [Sinomonas humi]|uniref:Histidine kinase n=1 Tax=Sinomonas humi TaxID=1338436 RepID=A0A0B2AJ50_9MICC|nr:GAF domain-containing sensor histidine kinase [Sinomonas humi]KHL01898.1 histidine kinase [Sinomonas humi]
MPDRIPRRADELLHEFVDRAHELVRNQTHMDSLLAAVVSMAEDLSLQSVLERVAQSAAELLGARYAAIGVLGEGGMLENFITVGIEVDQVELIGDVPTGHGVLGQLITDPRPLRLHDLHDHPMSVGFPANHPPMKTFLGVPIRVRDTVFGNLYLTEKERGADFTGEDEDLAVALAAAAGVAIQNARLYEDSRSRQRWLEAGAEASAALIAEDVPSHEGDLDLVAEHALRASDSVLAVIARREGDRLRVRTAVGALALAAREDLRCPKALQDADQERRAVILSDPEEVFGPGAGEKLGHVMAVPVGQRSPLSGRDWGNRLLLLARQAGAGAFSGTELASAAAFGSHVGLALDLNLAHRQREQDLISVDRDRIAQDLHDLVIQRLFAAGLSAQSLRRYTADPGAQTRITRLTEELDESIRELRSTIYSLHGHEAREEGLSQALLDAVHETVRDAPIIPRVNVEGRLEELPPALAAHLVAVAREAVSNAVRHSGAGTVAVALTVAEDEVELVVEDDGKGFADPARTSGLANMEQRAASVGGTSRVDSAPGSGTRVIWRAPLPR